MLKQQHQLFKGLLLTIDALFLAGSAVGAWAVTAIAYGSLTYDSILDASQQTFALLVIPIGLYCLGAFGLYRPRRDRSVASEIFQVFKASMATTGVTIVGVWAFGLASRATVPAASFAGLNLPADPERFQLAILGLTTLLGLGIERATFRLALQAARRRGWNLRHVAIIGSGRLGQIAGRTLHRNSWTGIDVTYFISHHPKPGRTTCLDRPLRGGLSDLEATLALHPVDAIYIALPSRKSEHLPEILQTLDRYPVDVRIIPDVNPRYLPQRMHLSELEGMPILSYRESPLNGYGGIFKRAMDMLGAVAALILFGPLMLLIALLVTLSGPGPVIFRQRRVSLGGEMFEIFKFRTMVDADTERTDGWIDGWTTRSDPRVTPIGRFLRRTSLDELPQLFNVLRGDMSLVGPRPERPELIARFREDWRGYMLRQHVKAGMTGWAQVNGLRGDTSLRKRLQYDLFYIRNWSLWLDVKILLATVFRGFVHPNAH